MAMEIITESLVMVIFVAAGRPWLQKKITVIVPYSISSNGNSGNCGNGNEDTYGTREKGCNRQPLESWNVRRKKKKENENEKQKQGN